MTEPNHHSRNLKLVSMFFILYWLLELTPTGDNQIRLQFISYEIHNPSMLAPVSWLILVYFAARFWLSSHGSTLKAISSHQRSEITRYMDKIRLSNPKAMEKIISRAESTYKKKHKANYEDLRNKESTSDNLNNKYKVAVSNSCSITWRRCSLDSQATYEEKVRGTMSDLFAYKFQTPLNWNETILLRIIGFIKFLYSSEKSPDYFLPWFLFTLAFISALLIQFDITPTILTVEIIEVSEIEISK
ncbi:hypothetical protein [Marinomonas sp.]